MRPNSGMPGGTTVCHTVSGGFRGGVPLPGPFDFAENLRSFFRSNDIMFPSIRKVRITYKRANSLIPKLDPPLRDSHSASFAFGYHP